MVDLLYGMIYQISRIHSRILTWNDAKELYLSDKQLHFLVIGLLGMALIFIFYPLFKWLANKGHILSIAWIYVFTLIIVITFAIEIGQGMTGTGHMEFTDIASGVMGFLLMFAVFAMIREVFLFIRNKIREKHH